MKQKLIFVELNEINFDYVRNYCARGELPTFHALLQDHGYSETTSEREYESLEPWIQWVTAHTGLTLQEHGIFRLGDIKNSDPEQIWEYLEKNGKTVGAVSPMNAKNRCAKPAFFMPDPWTEGETIGSPLLKNFHRAVSQAVNDNAQSRIAMSSAFWLMVALVRFARPLNYPKYLRYVASAARGRPWAKALVLDQLIADMFLRLARRAKPDFASVFLNAGAHIQHHYMFNSSAYDGGLRNPDWYVSADEDPLLEVYRLYDGVLASLRREFPNARLMIATGLHQDPHEETTFYWRLKDHPAFLARHDVPFRSVEPRMSRDFLVHCGDADEATAAAARLASMTAGDGQPLFEVDNRGIDLFVMLIWPGDIGADFMYRVGNQQHAGLKNDVAFVAIKNGEHNGVGYLLDTGKAPGIREQVPLTDVPGRICDAMGLAWRPA